MKEFAESVSSKDESPEDVLSHETQLEDFPFEESLTTQTPLEEFPFRDSSSQEMLPQDFSFEYGSLEETPLQDLSFADDSVGEKLSKDLPPKDDRDKLSKGLSFEEEEEEEDYADAPHIGHDIVKAFRAAIQWCDDVANEPNDIFTNFKSQLPFLIVVGGIILLLWIVRFIYG
jgi:hypothetical protein